MSKHKWPEDFTNCYSQRDLDTAVAAEREACAKAADDYAEQAASEGWTGPGIASRTARAVASLAEHTPGPWEADFDDAARIRDGAGNTLANVTFVHLRGRRDANEVLANARLIAAAPAMLEALQSALGYLRNAKIDLETGCPKRTAIQTLEGGLKLVDAAISSALGAGASTEGGVE